MINDEIGTYPELIRDPDGTERVVWHVPTGPGPSFNMANYRALVLSAVTAMRDNRAFLDIPPASLTPAQVAQQVRALTRQVNGIVRFTFAWTENLD